jgi:hypothetical protein
MTQTISDPLDMECGDSSPLWDLGDMADMQAAQLRKSQSGNKFPHSMSDSDHGTTGSHS